MAEKPLEDRRSPFVPGASNSPGLDGLQCYSPQPSTQPALASVPDSWSKRVASPACGFTSHPPYMAVRLNAWLADTFEWQLMLGNHWLRERHEQKKSGVKTERDRAWEDLYHDNGSCLDITNDIHSERSSALQVVQVRATRWFF